MSKVDIQLEEFHWGSFKPEQLLLGAAGWGEN